MRFRYLLPTSVAKLYSLAVSQFNTPFFLMRYLESFCIFWCYILMILAPIVEFQPPISNHFPTKTLTGCSALLVHGRGCHGASPGAEFDTTQQTQQRWLKHWDPGCHSATNSHMQELDDTASWEAPFGKTFVMMLEHRVEPLEKHWKHYDWIFGCGLKT